MMSQGRDNTELFFNYYLQKIVSTLRMCAYSHHYGTNIIVCINDDTENLAQSTKCRYEKINAGSKINARGVYYRTFPEYRSEVKDRGIMSMIG